MLGKKGLTSAEAQRFTNFIKELVKSSDVNIDNFQVLTSKAIRGNETYPIDTNVAIHDWSNKITEKAELYALSAWLMEGVKLKDDMLEVKRREQVVIDQKDFKETPHSPIAPKVTFKEFFNTQLTIKEKADYLANEATAAHIGKFIHNFDAVREVLEKYKPTEFQIIGANETVTVLHEELYDRDTLLSDLVKLQGQHRVAEKALNHILAKHKEWEANVTRQYNIDYQTYTSEVSVVTAHNQALMQKQRTAFENKKTTELEEIKKLMIVIPNQLQSTVDMVKARLDVSEPKSAE